MQPRPNVNLGNHGVRRKEHTKEFQIPLFNSRIILEYHLAIKGLWNTKDKVTRQQHRDQLHIILRVENPQETGITFAINKTLINSNRRQPHRVWIFSE